MVEYSINIGINGVNLALYQIMTREFFQDEHKLKEIALDKAPIKEIGGLNISLYRSKGYRVT